jgi:multiple sugar transport system permease protein
MKQRINNEYLTGLLFISPWLIGFFIWVIYPIGLSVYLSLCKYDGMTSPEFIGLTNYNELFADGLFWRSLWNTLYITFFGIPLALIFSLILAFILNQKRRGIAVYRTMIYLPCLTPLVAMSILWVWMFNSEFGLINYFLAKINGIITLISFGLIKLPLPAWFSDPLWAKPAMIIMGFWGVGGTMLIFLASLQDVPRALYESAEVDGAGWLRKQWAITLPMISPVIFFNLIMGIVGGFQYFTQAYVISNGTGGPQDSTLFYVLYLFNNAFPDWRMGYASAMAWILFFITLGLSLVVFRLSAKRVHYQGE